MSTNFGAPDHQAQAPAPTGLQTFTRYITQDSTRRYLQKALDTQAASFTANVIALVNNSPLLQKCDPVTVMFAAMKATALKLPLDQSLGYAYVVPYKGLAQFQIGWRGFIQLAIRTNLYEQINVRDVRQGEVVGEDFVSGDMQFAPLPPDVRSQYPVVGYLAFFKLTNGFKKQSFWTLQEITEHAQKFSKTYNSQGGVWQSNFDAMAKKTVLKLLISRFGPTSVEMQNAMSSDQAVLTEGARTYVDNRGETYTDETTVVAEDAPEDGQNEDAARVMAAAAEAEKRAAGLK